MIKRVAPLALKALAVSASAVFFTMPAFAQGNEEQVIVLRCSNIANGNETRNITLDLGQKAYSDQSTLANLPGGNSFRAPADTGEIQSITPGEVRFGVRTLNRYTGALTDNDGTYNCERVQKVF